MVDGQIVYRLHRCTSPDSPQHDAVKGGLVCAVPMFKVNCRAAFPGMEYYMSDKPPVCPICGAALHMVDEDNSEYASELKERLDEVHQKNLRLMGRRNNS